MRKIKPGLYLIFIAGALFFLAASLTSLLAVRNRLDSQNFADHWVEVRGSVDFSLVPRNNSLNITILTLKNPGIMNSGEFRFSLLQDGVLREIKFSGENIGDPSDLRFQFDPIMDSANKELTLRLEKISADQPTISVAVDKEGGLAFRAYNRVSDKREALVSLFQNWRSNVLNDPAFFVFWVLAVGFIAWLGRRSK